jgi:hypothetical protein
MYRRHFLESCFTGTAVGLSGCVGDSILTGIAGKPEELETADQLLRENESELTAYSNVIEDQQIAVNTFDPQPYIKRTNDAKEAIYSLSDERLSENNVELAEALLLLADQHIAAVRHIDEYVSVINFLEGAISYATAEEYPRAISELSGAEFSRQRADGHARTSIELLDELESDYKERIDWVQLDDNRQEFVDARSELDALKHVIVARKAEFEGYQKLKEGHEHYLNDDYSSAEFSYAAAKEQYSTARSELDKVMDHETMQRQVVAFFEFGKLLCEVEYLEEAAHHYEVGAQDARRGDMEAANEADRLAEEVLEKADQCRTNPFEEE